MFYVRLPNWTPSNCERKQPSHLFAPFCQLFGNPSSFRSNIFIFLCIFPRPLLLRGFVCRSFCLLVGQGNSVTIIKPRWESPEDLRGQWHTTIRAAVTTACFISGRHCPRSQSISNISNPTPNTHDGGQRIPHNQKWVSSRMHEYCYPDKCRPSTLTCCSR